MDKLWQDARFGARLLLRFPGVTAAALRLIRALLYQVSPTDPAVFALTAVGVALAALLGYLLPIDPTPFSSRTSMKVV